MVLDGRTILDKHYIMVPDDGVYDIEEQVQPNGFDLRIEDIIEVTGKAVLEGDSKMNYKQMQATKAFSKDGFISLKPGMQYLLDFRETIAVPDGYCAIIYPRSSLLRVGAFITSALWDTGFEGKLGASLRALNPIDIKIGARLAQVVFFKSTFNGLRYDGRYQRTTSQASFI